ncbi:MAG: hypothetical protein ACK53Z_00225 [Betaproteobacteria bacterium]|jgi:hypothetical protein
MTDKSTESHQPSPPMGVSSSEGLEPTRHVGQELYWEWSEYSHKKNTGEMVKITKIGRRWLELSNGYRADAATLYADGGKYSSPGRCFLNREAREAERARDAAWTALRNRMQYQAPDKVSAEDIAHATRLLGL